MRPPLVSRLQPFTSTVFAEMTALATRTGAVNLGQGFPDTDGPTGMLDAARDALYGGANQYPPGPGRPELRKAVAEHRTRYGLHYDPDTEVLVTAGATEAIAASLLALADRGDEVIAIEPYYDSYAAAIAMAGAQRRTVPLASDGERFALDVDALRAAVTPDTRAILVNSPHNPTGTVFTHDELTAIAEVCVDNDLIAVQDEVYEHLTFDDIEHTPLATLPGMRERTVSISSAGKTFNCTGWKIGWVCAPAELVAAVKTTKQFLTFVSGGPLQPAVAYALEHELGWVEQLRTSLAAKRDRLSKGLTEAGFAVWPSAGTYFVCADVRPLGFTDAEDLAWRLPELAGVAAVPVKVFTDHPDEWNHVLRFAFSKRDEVLDEAVERLHQLHRG
ncbi:MULTISPECIES: pyridoxal phosphate-dependent aminotransferase [Prauserella salsuginis group]|uniref:N-succinyldiaminopimelate aminotransferase n=2 Tax=Prauserella salsuginis group TaxID=2893672 RepID=A0A839XKL1_9PSEU|nr:MULTISPECIES: pyridoxal phosphate-dependent aminotransferase [Prauserella salsuginis group]MBB3662359.1 N-succinyldiaminopimelate aminotransferase [Prauserella sediminis]MCR3720070.1 N-succinyldiaminopimelate aminotransferase [Prauserella flava]MCR3736384.1 N-succinyldiaminopimelate aminotransferase [Prauserella salsuginis]